MDRDRISAIPSRISRQSRKSVYREDEIEHLIVVPPDGGWGWVIVFAVFFCNLVADGISYSFGLFLGSIAESYEVSIGNVTIVGSLMTSFYYLAGPVVSAMVNRFGFRCVAILGSSIAASGYVSASFCPGFKEFVFLAGIVCGIGLGMITITSIITVGYYFEKWRALAIGIATCGSGIGTLAMPPLINMLLEQFGWRNTYRVLAGIILVTAIAGMLFRPLTPIKVSQDEKEIKTVDDTDSIEFSDYDERTGCCKSWCRCKHHNVNYPTTADIMPHNTVIIEDLPIWDRLIYDSLSDSFDTYESTLKSVYPSNSNAASQRLQLDKTCRACCHRCMLCFCCGRCHTVARPMYRDDIFFGHSLMLLPKYKEAVTNQKLGKSRKFLSISRSPTKQPNITGYHLSVTRVTTLREIHHYEKKCACPLAMLRPLSTMLDFHLLKSSAFQLFAWSGAFIVFGYMVPYLYIVDRAVKAGSDEHVAFWLISTIGAANTVGRITSGILPSVMNLRVVEYCIVWLCIAGIITVVSGFIMDIKFQFFYASVYGMAGSCIVTLRPIIIVELFGIENLTNAYGLQLMFMGVSAFFGTMVAGLVYDATKDYNYSFYIAGGCLVFSAILLCFIRNVRRKEKLASPRGILK